MSEVDFIPLSQFSARYAQGWRLVNPLDPNDYAALMRAPGSVTPNTQRAAAARNRVRTTARADDEVNRLRDTLAQITGCADVERAMRAFGVSLPKAQILLLLVNRGLASHETIIDAIYDDDARVSIENPEGAVRDHVKRLRPALKRHGITFETSYGYGFEMSEAMRSRAKAMLACCEVSA